MPFSKGHKLSAKGGKREGAGRPSKETKEIQQKAEEIARDYIEKHVKKLMDTYIGLAAGQVIRRNKRRFNLTVDPATTRHAVDKLVPTKTHVSVDGEVRIVEIEAPDPDKE